MINKIDRKLNRILFNYKLNSPIAFLKDKRYYKIKSFLGLTKKGLINIDKVLIGQQAGIPLEKWIPQTNEIERISTSLQDSPYVKILKSIDSDPSLLQRHEDLKTSAYYKMMITCLKKTGHYMGISSTDELYKQVEYFYNLYLQFDPNFKANIKNVNGRSKPNTLIKVNKLYHSDCYEIVDGHHRAAIQYMKGAKELEVEILDDKFSYLQRIILNSNQTFRVELYQPVAKPEVLQWPTIRNCRDRLDMMKHWLSKNEINSGTYIDMPCSYGFFVKEFKNMGFDAIGLDIDTSSIKIAHEINSLQIEIDQKDIIQYLEKTSDKFDIVSCLSLLHHFAMGRINYPYMNIVQNLDKVTKKVLFIDTGQSHEEQYLGELDEWNDEFIINLFLENTSFTKFDILGKDNDNIGIQKNNNRRTLFAFYK